MVFVVSEEYHPPVVLAGPFLCGYIFDKSAGTIIPLYILSKPLPQIKKKIPKNKSIMHFILLFPLLSATLLPQTIANVIPVDDNLVAAVDNLQNLDEYDTIDHRISDNILQDGIEILKSIPPQPPRAEDTLSDLERQFAEPQGACKGFSGAIHVTCEGPEVDTDPPKSGVLAFVLNCNGGRFYFFLPTLFSVLPLSIRAPL